MDFRLGPKSDAFREEVRAFLDEHLDPETIERAHRTGTNHDKDFHRAIGRQGWIAASWPAEYGGQDRDPFEMTALRDELRLAGAPTDGMGLTLIVCQTIRRVATEEQKADFLPRALAGEIIMSLGYSEPDSGSDVASIKTTATRDGDEWVINGQKMFTTLAHVANYVFLLARTNHDVPKHKGLTMFLVPLDSPGIEIHPVHTVGGERTNATYYTDVRISDHYRIGEVDQGWHVMTVALTFERGGFGLSEADRVWERAVGWAKETRRPDGSRVIDDPYVRERLATMRTNNEVARLLANRTSFVAATGGLPGVEGSMHKLFYAESMTADAAELVDMLGAEGVLPAGRGRVPRRRMGRAPVPARRRNHHLRGHQRDAALDHRRAGPRAPEIRPLTPSSVETGFPARRPRSSAPKSGGNVRMWPRGQRTAFPGSRSSIGRPAWGRGTACTGHPASSIWTSPGWQWSAEILPPTRRTSAGRP